MKIIFQITAIVILAYFQVFSQTSESNEKATSKITTSNYKFGSIEINLKQIKGRNSYSCSAWLEISKDRKVLHKREYTDIEALGGSSGLFVPSDQPSDKYFMINKLGDYDGRSLLIDKEGNLLDIPGGLYLIANDKRYLFIEHDQDCCGSIRVFDLQLGKIVFCDRKNEHSISDYGDYETINFYKKGNDVFVIFSYDNEITKNYRYDYEKNTLVEDTLTPINLSEKINLGSQIEKAEDCTCREKKK